jgi:hypothetical protein
VAGYLVAEEVLEAAQVGGKGLGEPVAEFAGDRSVVGTRSPGRQEPGQPGALIGPPSRMEPDLASGQPLEIVQARDGLVRRAVVAMPAERIRATTRATPDHLNEVFSLVGRQGVEP